MAKGKVRIDHCDLFPEIVRNKWRHGNHLAFHIGYAGLQRVAIQHPAGDVMPFRNDEIGQL